MTLAGSATYVGCDPGLGGALAVWRPADEMLLVIDTPTHEIRGKRRIDLYQLGKDVRSWDAVSHIVRVVVEQVGAFPGQSPNSMFNFGFAAGALQGAIACAGLPMVLVVPQVWKKVYGIPGGRENKDASRQKASMLFPKFAHLWARKKDDGRAEAVLLAHYGSKLA
jgi:crossover junction endodeoxyribonuclease RuvC